MLRLIYSVSETNKVEDSEAIENNVERKEGFLIKVIRNGNIVKLDNLHRANSIIIERLNELSDSRDNFYLRENPLENIIEINDKFRIIGIPTRNLISKMSPALLNRFDIINLENQLGHINEVEFNDLVKKFLENENNDLSKDIVNEMFPSLGDENEFNKNKELDECVINDKIQSKKEEIEYSNIKLTNIKDISIILNTKEFKNKNKKTPKEILNIIDFIYELHFTGNELI